jgi:hypothetical protein
MKSSRSDVQAAIQKQKEADADLQSYNKSALTFIKKGIAILSSKGRRNTFGFTSLRAPWTRAGGVYFIEGTRHPSVHGPQQNWPRSGIRLSRETRFHRPSINLCSRSASCTGEAGN